MRYYIVDKNGDVYGDFNDKFTAEKHLELYSDKEIKEKEIEIIEGA